MRLHILGVCGTFMAGIAKIAKELGYEVSGSDENVYPPMSTQLENLGIKLFSGYAESNLDINPDFVVIGNAIKRGNPELEAVLNKGMNYTSGPQWLAENVLYNKHVLAVSGTHGKTTTTSLLTWILDFAGKKPGFLIGGVPENFGVSARIGESSFFVIEADEYDSAFFDKRSKFIHYRPSTLILNNLEFDHADIFANLDEIKKQFHHLVRTIPSEGLIIKNGTDNNLNEVLQLGCWTPVENFADEKNWHAELIESDGSEFNVFYESKKIGTVHWALLGLHNMQNALAAIAAAKHVGVDPENAIKALTTFKNVKRRLEIKGCYNDVTVYDDFAHHPTAIYHTLHALRQHVGNSRILAVLEFGSYTMRSGTHQPEAFVPALAMADQVFLKEASVQQDYGKQIANALINPAQVFTQTEQLVSALAKESKAGDHILVMSNTGFDGIFGKLPLALEQKHDA